MLPWVHYIDVLLSTNNLATECLFFLSCNDLGIVSLLRNPILHNRRTATQQWSTSWNMQRTMGWILPRSSLVGTVQEVLLLQQLPKNWWEDRTSPSYQTLLDKVLTPVQEFSATYINDIIFFRLSWEEHLRHLRVALEALRKAGLTANPCKCKIAQSDISRLHSGKRQN